MEHIVSCLDPKRVYNKYLDEYVWVSCGKCDACKKRRSSKWVIRLEAERRVHPFCFFVTLTYNEESLPRLFFTCGNTVIEDKVHDVSIPYDELFFSSTADKQYFDERMALSGIPYANFEDIQLFHKRLNKFFHDKVSKTYQNFRYFTVSEYGSTTLRPHFHSIYFVDRQCVADYFEEGISSCWQYGINDCQSVESSANSYVAQYLNELFDLPSFYQHRSICPKFVCSKRPPLGGCFYDETEFRQIFENTLTKSFKQVYATDTSFGDVPLLKSVENSIFPKCKAFSRIPHSLRVALYGIAQRRFYQRIERDPRLMSCQSEFYGFVSNVRQYLYNFGLYGFSGTSFDEYLISLVDGFSERGINALRRLYYMSKRVLKWCCLWKVSLDYYVRKIELYFDKKEYQVVSLFYRFQQNFSSPDEMVHLYPEFAYKHRDCVIPLKECYDYQVFKSDSEYAQQKNTKTHFKNAYFQSLEDRGKPEFNVLLNYYYAKKCNEIIETFGLREPE